MDISKATLQNWQRLKADKKDRLQHRANKSRSVKRIYPLEYICCRENIHFAEEVVRLSIEQDISREDVIYTLAVSLLETKGLLLRSHVQQVLEEYCWKEHAAVRELPVPQNENDILGFVYQCLLCEGEKSVSGSYYTPRDIVENMVSGWELSEGKSFCDPCCGSGAFLLAVPVSSPEQLYGCDKDPLAVFICKINLLIKFAGHDFIPRIFCCDYLENDHALSDQKFDFIATNPPWGAEKNRRRGESFSTIFRLAAGQLKAGGKMNFLFPESVLRIKSHAELRRFILQKRLEKIVCYDGSFTGVMTKYAAIRISAAPPAENFERHCGGDIRICTVGDIAGTKDCCFTFLSEAERDLLRQIRGRKHFYLNGSSFALGIVTGDNKGKVKDTCDDGMERVFTGKEIGRYVLKPAVKYLRYDRTSLQQTAPEEYYRAPEKLVYKFISDKLVFAYDATGSLVLNSANVLIPEIPGMSIKTVLAFLNSNFLRYYYSVVFGDIKILKGNLMQLPFPEITPETAAEIDRLVDQILNGDTFCDEPLQKLIYDSYQLSPEQISVVETYLAGTDKKS